MNFRVNCIFLWITSVLILFSCSCGQKKEAPSDERKPQQKTAESPRPPLETEMSEVLPLEDAPFRGIIEKAGFVPINYRRFPAARPGERGEIVIYRSAKKRFSGGVIYLKVIGKETAPSWHWYFEDAAPDSAYPFELNDDGLWDMRIVLNNGRVLDIIQEETFTLYGSLRNDWIALNGASSPPVDSENAVWKCFDNNPMTVWRSTLSGRDEVYLEISAPFGIQRGILTIKTLDRDCPYKCRLYADGEIAQEFELKNESAPQKIQVNSTVRTSKKIRFAVLSVYGEGDQVAIAELSLE